MTTSVIQNLWTLETPGPRFESWLLAFLAADRDWMITERSVPMMEVMVLMRTMGATGVHCAVGGRPQRMVVLDGGQVTESF